MVMPFSDPAASSMLRCWPALRPSREVENVPSRSWKGAVRCKARPTPSTAAASSGSTHSRIRVAASISGSLHHYTGAEPPEERPPVVLEWETMAPQRKTQRVQFPKYPGSTEPVVVFDKLY